MWCACLYICWNLISLSKMLWKQLSLYPIDENTNVVVFVSPAGIRWDAGSLRESHHPRRRWRATWTPSSRVRSVTTRSPATSRCEDPDGTDFAFWNDADCKKKKRCLQYFVFQGENSEHGNHIVQRVLGGVSDSYNMYPFWIMKGGTSAHWYFSWTYLTD